MAVSLHGKLVVMREDLELFTVHCGFFYASLGSIRDVSFPLSFTNVRKPFVGFIQL